MPVTAGPLWVFAALVFVAGAAKVAAPAAIIGALKASELPSSRRAVQTLGVVEFVVGVYAIVFGDLVAGVAMVVLYLAFTAFVVNALVRSLPVSSCGCFAKEDTPPTWIHVVITGLGVGAGVAASVSPPGELLDLLSGDGTTLIFLAMTGIAFAFAYMSLTTLPKILGAAAKRP